MKSNLEPRSGPRIFVGKLNKETTENDVKVHSPANSVSYTYDSHALCQLAVSCVASGILLNVRQELQDKNMLCLHRTTSRILGTSWTCTCQETRSIALSTEGSALSRLRQRVR